MTKKYGFLFGYLCLTIAAVPASFGSTPLQDTGLSSKDIQDFVNRDNDSCSKTGPGGVQGTLRIVRVDDVEMMNNRIIYEVRTADQCTYFLDVKNKNQLQLLSKKTTNTEIKVRGIFNNHVCTVLEDEGTHPLIFGNDVPIQISEGGTQKVLVILLNFQQQALSCSLSQVDALMNSDATSINSFYRQASFGKQGFVGKVVGPYTITDSGHCDYSSWDNQGSAAAIHDGISLAAYDGLVYVLPTQTSCGWAGLGSVGGNPSTAWILYCSNNRVIAHELGHNIGMMHAATSTSEYGDGSDVMGMSYNSFNAAHKWEMGWIPASKTLDVRSDGIFTLATSDLDPTTVSDPQILRIYKPDSNDYYYLSYRKNTAWPYLLSTAYTSGVNIHTYATGTVKTYFLKGLSDAGTYSDSPNHLNFTQISHTDTTVTVSISGLGCQHNPPQLALSPSNRYVRSGANASYQLTITNTDSAGCSSSNFTSNCSSTALGFQYKSSTQALAPSSAGTVTIPLTKIKSLANGPYPIACTVSSSNLVGNTSVTAQLTVDNARPTVLQGLHATQTIHSITLTWLPSKDNNGISDYVVLRNGTTHAVVMFPTFTEILVKGRKYSYQVYARDFAGNISAKSNTLRVIGK